MRRADRRRLCGALVLSAAALVSCAQDEPPAAPQVTTATTPVPTTTTLPPSLTTLVRPTTSAPPGSTTTSTQLPTTLPITTTSTITTTTTAAPSTTTTTTTTTAAPGPFAQVVALRFESRVPDVATADFAAEALGILTDSRGWIQAGFSFVEDPESDYLVVLAEPGEVDQLCLPLQTKGFASCQNGPVVALNAQRWRHAVDHWDGDLALYRGYLVTHEVGHLIGQRHPTPRCPVPGRPAGVMEPQTGGLKGCVGNAWPRDWELVHASVRPVVYAPLPDWGPDPVPANGES